ncbi:MAG: hypothetical protein JNN09_02015 [Alphaproteobacteria bacterium]|nr:hypothetical protein [Alphaproteobacteria bacterium]
MGMNCEAYEALQAGKEQWLAYCQDRKRQADDLMKRPRFYYASDCTDLNAAFRTVSVWPYSGVCMLEIPIKGVDLSGYNFTLCDNQFEDASGTNFSRAKFGILPGLRYDANNPPNLEGVQFNCMRMFGSLAEAKKDTSRLNYPLGALGEIYSLDVLQLFLQQNPSDKTYTAEDLLPYSSREACIMAAQLMVEYLRNEETALEARRREREEGENLPSPQVP